MLVDSDGPRGGATAIASFSREEIDAIKIGITGGRPYAKRVSFALAVRLFQMGGKYREQAIVLDELDFLEGLRSNSRTKLAKQFRHPPLHPLWHKHFSAPRHMVRNVGLHWNSLGRKQAALDAMIREVASEHGANSDLWPGVLAHRFAHDGYTVRASAGGLTGDWIIFGKHEGKNFYLDLATHEEGKDSDRLFQKLCTGSAAEFSFLFDKESARRSAGR